MATNTAGTAAREYTTAQTHYLTKAITYADNGTSVSLGYVPAGAYVIRGGVVVSTAFNGNSANTLNIGTASSASAFASAIALGTAGIIVADDLATTTAAYCSTDTEMKAAVTSTASASAGAGMVWIEYLVPQG